MKSWFTRKRILLLSAAAVLTALILIILSICGTFGSGQSNGVTKYTITAEYFPAQRTLEARMTVDYVNLSGATLNEIVFLLFPNAFSSPETAPFETDYLAQAYPGGFSPGGIEVLDVTVNGKEAQPVLSDSRQQLTVPLSKALGSGRAASVSMSFTVTLPAADGRFGAIGDTVNLGNWYPVSAVNRDGKWIYSDYELIGDPFYTDIADYSVTITAPSEYVMAASAPAQKQESDGKAVWQANGRNLRDFAVFLGKNYETAARTCGGVTLTCYHQSANAQAELALDSAEAAIKLFGELYGPYPYTELNIAETSFFIGGMEYPGLMLIDKSYFENGNLHPLENVVVHETAHQWWYGGVGNDQVNEAWIDEGMATFSTMLYYQRYKKPETFRMYYKYYITNGYRFSRESARQKYESLNEVINRPLSEFEDSLIYNMLCYEKSAMMLQAVRELLGDELFFADIKELYTANVGKTVSQKDIIDIFSRNTSRPVKEFIESWLAGKVHIP